MVCCLTPCSCRDFPKEESRRFQVWKNSFPFVGAGGFLRWVAFFAYLWSVELCRWIVLPEREASEGVKLDNDELNSLIKYGMGCGAAWPKARSAN